MSDAELRADDRAGVIDWRALDRAGVLDANIEYLRYLSRRFRVSGWGDGYKIFVVGAGGELLPVAVFGTDFDDPEGVEWVESTRGEEYVPQRRLLPNGGLGDHEHYPNHGNLNLSHLWWARGSYRETVDNYAVEVFASRMGTGENPSTVQLYDGGRA